MATVPVWLFLGLFVLAPVAILVAIALARPADGVPPFALALDPSTLASRLADPLTWHGVAGSLVIATAASLACLALGLPMAIAIARVRPGLRAALLLAVMLPFWSGFLLRMTAWIGLLRDGGAVDVLARSLGLAAPRLLHSDTAMLLGMVHSYLPFMVLPLVATLTRLDPLLPQAAADLGAGPVRTFMSVALPLAAPGIRAGIALVFLPATGEVVIPELLGSPARPTIGRVLWDAFFAESDWPGAAALALLLLVGLLVPMVLLRDTSKDARTSFFEEKEAKRPWTL